MMESTIGILSVVVGLPIDKHAIMQCGTVRTKKKRNSEKDHICSRGILNEDQLLNFIESQVRFYNRNWREMAQGCYPEEYKPHVELERSESEKSNLPLPFLNVPRVSISSAVYSPSSGRKFRANRGLTGLYSAVKGNTFNVIKEVLY